LVESEPALRDSVGRILARAGYRVLGARSAEQALELLGGPGRDCALLLTGVIMPGMWGEELADRARASCPELRVLFMLGHAERFLRRGRAPAPTPMLTKPFSEAVLLAEVAKLIGSRPATAQPSSATDENITSVRFPTTPAKTLQHAR
jgi:CheY-like chemotaxis protein